MTTITDRVAAGAAFLDEHDPEWWRADVDRAIDQVTLNHVLASECVLGQRCPVETLAGHIGIDPADLEGLDFAQAYFANAERLAGGFDDRIELAAWARSHGFNAESNAEFPDLTAEWKRVITDRRSA